MATITVTIGTPAVVTHTAHGLVTGKMVGFTTTGTLPTGMDTLHDYYVSYIDADSYYIAHTRKSAELALASQTVTFDNTTEIFTKASHGLSIGDSIMLTAGTMPTGFTAGTRYYVHPTSFTTGQFRLSLAPYGTALTGTTNGTSVLFHTIISTTGSQSGTHTGGEVFGIIDEENSPILDGAGAVNLSNVPLPVLVTLTNIIEGSNIRVSQTGDNTELFAATVGATGSVSFTTYYQGSATIVVRLSPSAGTRYLEFNAVGIISSTGMDYFVSQSLDTYA